MPTLNKRYNETLASWAAAGKDSKPECENCGADLTGAKVVETAYDWRCVPRSKIPEVNAPDERREDFYADV